MVIPLCKASLVAAMAVLLGRVGFNNVVDYGDNWTFVQHVMGMDTVFPDSTQRWRAIRSAPVQELFYLASIATEALSGGLLMLGAALFRRARSESYTVSRPDLTYRGIATDVGERSQTYLLGNPDYNTNSKTLEG